MKGRDLGKRVTDSLLLAHTLVAQGTLYLKQYKTDEERKRSPTVSAEDLSSGDPPGARTQDPNIKSVVLYLLS